MGVISASPQKARSRAKPEVMRLIGGIDMPCVLAAPRATLVQKPSTILGVTRTSRTGGESMTYSDQFLKSSSGRTSVGSGSGLLLGMVGGLGRLVRLWLVGCECW